MFRIRVHVESAVADSRTALLKRDGQVVECATREAAEAEAQAFRDRMRGQTYYFHPASFQAWVVEPE